MDKQEYVFAGRYCHTWCRDPNPNSSGGVCSRERGHGGPHVAHSNPSGIEYARWDNAVDNHETSPSKWLESVYRSTIASDPKPKTIHATVTVDAKDAMREVEKRIAPIKDVLTRTLQWLTYAGLSESRAMSVSRREQLRELVRDISAAVKPEKAGK